MYLHEIKDIKDHGIKAFYSQMKAYILTPEQMAEEARLLEDNGIINNLLGRSDCRGSI